MKMSCDSCGHEHDVFEMEPAFRRPDDVALLSPAERAASVIETSNSCELKEPGNDSTRYFLRALIPVPVHGRDDVCWGVWV
jgi:hypothetical protein